MQKQIQRQKDGIDCKDAHSEYVFSLKASTPPLRQFLQLAQLASNETKKRIILESIQKFW